MTWPHTCKLCSGRLVTKGVMSSAKLLAHIREFLGCMGFAYKYWLTQRLPHPNIVLSPFRLPDQWEEITKRWPGKRRRFLHRIASIFCIRVSVWVDAYVRKSPLCERCEVRIRLPVAACRFRIPGSDSEFQDPIQIVRIRFEKRTYNNYYKLRKLIRGTNL